ncbi:MAG: 5'-nucleotidase C-terminal domain-containing protein [Gammaproteobacteria bacterium]|nr:5'-nucleotidase C-terminal domain-containing protein [Gammaproteobacteria bacterium]
MHTQLTTLLAVTVITLTGCGGGGNTSSSNPTTATPIPITPATPTPVPAPTASVTLLHFSDLHAHLTPHWDRVPDALPGQTAATTQVVQRGGLARLATVIKAQRATHPNSILMNIGDTYHGGVEGLYSLGNAVVDPVNALGIDVGVPGNWDYAYGPIVTRLRYASLTTAEATTLGLIPGVANPNGEIKRPNFPNLAANVSYTAPPSKNGQGFLPATWMTTRGGISVGVIGLSSDIVAHMAGPLAAGLSFVEGQSNYKTLVEANAAVLRRQGAQLVVVMSELGLHKNKQLADVLTPNTVDIIFSAHTHEPTYQPLTTNSGTRVVEAGNDGNLGVMTVSFTAGVATGFDWKLIAIDNTIAEDSAVKALVDTARAPFLVADPNIKLPLPIADITLHQPISAVVGHSQGALDRRHALENTFNKAYADGMRQLSGTRLAMTPGFRFDAVIAQPGYLLEDNTVASGDLTLEDVYRFFPTAYPLATGQVTGSQLKLIIENALTRVFSKDMFNHAGGWLEGFSGLGMDIDVAGNDGARIVNSWTTDDAQPVADTTTYSMTGCHLPSDAADVLCGNSGFTQVALYINPATNSGWNEIDLFLEMLKNNSFGGVTAERFTDTSQTPVWPQAPFVQPLW